MNLTRALMFVLGLNLAGSDSPYFPWVNGVGIMIFFCMALVPTKKKEEVTRYG